MEEARWFL